MVTRLVSDPQDLVALGRGGVDRVSPMAGVERGEWGRPSSRSPLCSPHLMARSTRNIPYWHEARDRCQKTSKLPSAGALPLLPRLQEGSSLFSGAGAWGRGWGGGWPPLHELLTGKPQGLPRSCGLEPQAA